MPTQTLSFAPLDWAVMALFLAAILGLGFSARIRDSSIVQYLVAGRSLSLPAFVATLVCTWYGGILGVGESVSYYGIGSWIILGVPYYVFALVYALVFANRVRGATQISIPERLADRWGKSVGVLGAVLLFLLAVPAAHVLMLAVLVQQFTGWSRDAGLVAGSLIGLALLYRGGLLADVRMSLLAFVMMYVGFITIDAVCMVHTPPLEAARTIDNTDLLTFSGGNGWPMILSFFILGAWTLVDPAFHQRVASAESLKTGKRGVLVSVVFWMLFDLLSMSAGLYAMALVKPQPGDPLTIFPVLGNQILPAGLKAVFVCGMLGTIASAMVGYTLVSGATLGREIAARIKGNLDESRTTFWIKCGLVASILAAAVLARTIHSVVDLWYAWSGVTVGAVLIPVTVAYVSKTDAIRPKWVFASMAVSASASLTWLVYGVRTNNLFLEVDWMKFDGKWQIVMAPVPDDLQRRAVEVVKISMGTLLPGLVISALVIAIGRIATNRIVRP